MSDIASALTTISIPTPPGDLGPVDLGPDDVLFIVGPNGSGKSKLFERVFNSIGADGAEWITAHRQTWFHSDTVQWTAQGRPDYGISAHAKRASDENAQDTLNMIMYDLKDVLDARAYKIMGTTDAGNDPRPQAHGIEHPFEEINGLLEQGQLDVSVHVNSKGVFTARRNGSTYSICDMSDGQRSAVILAARVLLADPGKVILIDEPERHLHRSQAVQFISALMAKRPDCAYMVSTHELGLPLACPEAPVLILRSMPTPIIWDATLLPDSTTLPEDEDIKRVILGGRETVLFVEGRRDSRDTPIYRALFPSGVTVEARGTCVDVQRSVAAIDQTKNQHRTRAFGIVDRDNLSVAEIDKLDDDLHVLPARSVEYLYYFSKSMQAVAEEQASSRGLDPDELVRDAIGAALTALGKPSIPEKMAARRCHGDVRRTALAGIPTQNDIASAVDAWMPPPLDLPSILRDEVAGKLDELIARYPVREAGNVFPEIAKALRCRDYRDYERIVVEIASREGSDLQAALLDMLRPITDAISSITAPTPKS